MKLSLKAFDAKSFIDANAPKRWRIAATYTENLTTVYLSPNKFWSAYTLHAGIFSTEQADTVLKECKADVSVAWRAGGAPLEDVRLEPVD